MCKKKEEERKYAEELKEIKGMRESMIKKEKDAKIWKSKGWEV